MRLSDKFHEKQEERHRAFPGVIEASNTNCPLTAANTVAAAPNVELIHPGVLKYLKGGEIGE